MVGFILGAFAGATLAMVVIGLCSSAAYWDDDDYDDAEDDDDGQETDC